MTERTNDKIKEILLKAHYTWLSIADIWSLMPNAKGSTIARCLRLYSGKLSSLYQWQFIPGDAKRGKEWAIKGRDTSGWSHAGVYAPIATKRGSRQKKQSKTPLVASAIVATSPIYKGVTMCLSTSTVAKTSLVNAVGDLVMKEFVPAGKKFSAHDVTKYLRTLVSHQSGTPSVLVDPTETGTVFVGGKSVPRIEHEDVKAIVHEIFNSGLMAGYDRNFDGSHFEYDLTANKVAPIPAPLSTAVNTTGITSGRTVANTDPYDGSSTI